LCWETISRKLIRERKSHGRKNCSCTNGCSATLSAAVKWDWVKYWRRTSENFIIAKGILDRIET